MAPIKKAIQGALSAFTKPIRAYHGTAHDFDRFDASKLLTGEGANVYGSGLYFTGTEDVAKGYRKRLAGDDIPMVGDRTAEELYYEASKRGDKPVADILENYLVDFTPDELKQVFTPERYSPEHVKALDALLPKLHKAQQGHVYEVDIHADPDSLIDWDKPVAGQSPRLREVLGDHGIEPADKRTFNIGPEMQTFNPGRRAIYANDGVARQVYADPFAMNPDMFMVSQGLGKKKQHLFDSNLDDLPDLIQRHFADVPFSPMTGGNAYRKLGTKLGNEEATAYPRASQALNDAGIPGIKYLDGMSRGAGEGTSNYVTFGDDLIDIKRKYEQGGEVEPEPEEHGAGGLIKKLAKPITAFHGGHRDFDKFDISKLGEGEGEIAYGRGLYFAGKEDVGKYYRDVISRAKGNFDFADKNTGSIIPPETPGVNEIKDLYKTYSGQPNGSDTKHAVEKWRRWANDYERQFEDYHNEAAKLAGSDPDGSAFLRQRVEEMRKQQANWRSAADMLENRQFKTLPGGKIYEVDIHADPQTMVQWDLPIEEQNKAVQDYLRETAAARQPDRPQPWSPTNELQRLVKDKQAVQDLNERGVPGVRYLDGVSRARGDGDYNYVTFGDDLVDIKRKYGGGGIVKKLARAEKPPTSVTTHGGKSWQPERGTIQGDDPGYVEILADVKKVDADFAKDKGMYVGPGGEGQIRTRYPDFGQWHAENPDVPVIMPRAGLTDPPYSQFSFGNGRHRFAYMRDNGVEAIPMTVDRETADLFRERYGWTPPEEPEGFAQGGLTRPWRASVNVEDRRPVDDPSRSWPLEKDTVSPSERWLRTNMPFLWDEGQAHAGSGEHTDARQTIPNFRMEAKPEPQISAGIYDPNDVAPPLMTLRQMQEEAMMNEIKRRQRQQLPARKAVGGYINADDMHGDDVAEEASWVKILGNKGMRALDEAAELRNVIHRGQKPSEQELRDLWHSDGIGIDRSGNMFQELDDSKAKLLFKPEPGPEQEAGESYAQYLARRTAWERAGGKPLPTNQVLSDVIQHDEMFDVYPDLKKLPLSWRGLERQGWSGPEHKGSMLNMGRVPAKMAINPRGHLVADDFLSTILHENQHAIQGIEGWSGGSNHEIGRMLADKANSNAEALLNAELMADRLAAGHSAKSIFNGGDFDHLDQAQKARAIDLARSMTREGLYDASTKAADLKRHAYPDYHAAYELNDGEMAARNVQRRMWLDENERAQKFWKDTEDRQGQMRHSGYDYGVGVYDD